MLSKTTFAVRDTILTSKNEAARRVVEERLAHPVDPVLVDTYRSLVSCDTADTARQGEHAALEDTAPSAGRNADECAELESLKRSYQALVSGETQLPMAGLHLGRRIGQGGQGIVFLAARAGADDFSNQHLALKFFSPHKYSSVASYEKDMRRIARVGSIIAGIDQGNVLDVCRFESADGIRMMLMKRVKGYDLRELMNPGMLECVKGRDHTLWTELTKAVAGAGPQHTQFQPGAAVAVIRSCLEALDNLHSRGIVHGDVRPSNIMITPEGEVKLVDTGSALEWKRSPRPHFYTPRYAALEVLEQGMCTPKSDLASLGYVLVELLTGNSVFPGRHRGSTRDSYLPEESSAGINLYKDSDLAKAKRRLPGCLEDLLRHHSPLLRQLCRNLIDPDPQGRFEHACAAELHAFKFIQELEKARLSCHFRHEFRRWIKTLEADHDVDW